TARLAVTTASGSKVALSKRTRDPIGSTPGLGVPPGTSPGSGSAPSGSGWPDLARFTRPPPCADETIALGGYASVIGHAAQHVSSAASNAAPTSATRSPASSQPTERRRNPG